MNLSGIPGTKDWRARPNLPRQRAFGLTGHTMVTLRQVQRAAEREQQLRAIQQALRQTFDYVATEPVPDSLRALVETLERKLNSSEP